MQIYVVGALDGCYNSNAKTVFTTGNKGTPVILTETNKTCTSFKANWQAISGIYDYRLQVFNNSRMATRDLVLNTKFFNRYSIIVPGLDPVVRYYYTISIVGCDGVTYTSAVKDILLSNVTKSNAGIDQINTNSSPATLNGNQPINGTGVWSIKSGAGGSFSNANLRNSTFTGSTGILYTLVWTISYNGCVSTDEMQVSFGCGGPITDSRDNKVYKTVYLSNLCWLAENLDYGTYLSTSTSTTQPSTGSVFKYCYDNNQSNCSTYGGLYQWDNLMRGSTIYTSTQGICPNGWHVPTETEFASIWPNNYTQAALLDGGSSKFNAKLGGQYNWGLNQFLYFNSWAYFYTNGYWYNDISSTTGQVGKYNQDKRNAISVRCVKN